MLSGYYKACCDYGRFLENEPKYEEARNIFKKGFDNCQQFCYGEYYTLFLSTSNFNQLLSDYNTISFLLKNDCINYSFERLGQSSFFL